MDKIIKNLKSGSIAFLILFMLGALGAQWWLINNPPIYNSLNTKQNKIEFINHTEDIKTLREASLLLVESDYAYTEHLNELFIFIRNISLILLANAVYLVYYVFKLRKVISNNQINSDNQDLRPK